MSSNERNFENLLVQMKSKKNLGKEGGNSLSVAPNIIFFFISISFGIWSIIVANSALSDPNAVDYANDCYFWTLATCLNIFGILHMVALGLSLCGMCFSIPGVLIMKCAQKADHEPIEGEEQAPGKKIGKLCVDLVNCVVNPLQAILGITIFVYFIIINVYLFSYCPTSTVPIVQAYYGSILAIVIVYWVYIGIVAICLPLLICCIIVTICCCLSAIIGGVALAQQ